MKYLVLSLSILLSMNVLAQGGGIDQTFGAKSLHPSIWESICTDAMGSARDNNLPVDVLQKIDFSGFVAKKKALVNANCKNGFVASGGNPIKGFSELAEDECSKIKDQKIQVECREAFYAYQDSVHAYGRGAIHAFQNISYEKNLGADCADHVSSSERQLQNDRSPAGSKAKDHHSKAKSK